MSTSNLWDKTYLRQFTRRGLHIISVRAEILKAETCYHWYVVIYMHALIGLEINSPHQRFSKIFPSEYTLLKLTKLSCTFDSCIFYVTSSCQLVHWEVDSHFLKDLMLGNFIIQSTIAR